MSVDNVCPYPTVRQVCISVFILSGNSCISQRNFDHATPLEQDCCKERTAVAK